MGRLGLRVVLVLALAVGACVDEATEQPSGAPEEVTTTTTERVTTTTTSTTSTTTPVNPPCAAVVDELEGGEALSGGVDLVDLATRNELAPLPVPGADAAIISDREDWTTGEEFVAATVLDDPVQRLEDLAVAGFRRGTSVRMEFGRDSFGVIVMALGSPEQAAAYRSAHLWQVCARADQMRAIPGITGGAAFYRADTDAARAAVVVGPYEVNLDICTCVEVVDRLALAEEWAVAIVEDLQQV